MTTKEASKPDVLERTVPATSATSDMPGEGTVETIKAPPTSESAGEKPAAQTTEPAKSAPSKEKTPPAEGEVKTETVETKTETETETKPKPAISERFSDLTAKRKAAEAAATAAETARVAAEARADKLATDLETALAAIQKVVPPAPEDVRPDRAKFDDPNKYDDALAEWAGKKAAKLAKAEAEAGFTKQRETEAATARNNEAAAQNAKIAADYTSRVETFKKDAPDFDEVVMNEDIPISQHMGAAILNMPDGPKVAYHLGKHPEEAARIAALSPPFQLMEIGKLSVALAAPPKTTTTPEPITPIKGGRAAAAAKDPNTESMDDYAARRSAELRPSKGVRS